MRRERIVEAAFLIPIREDKHIGTGRRHGDHRWQALQRDLFEMFLGWSRDPGLVEGVYRDPDTGQPVFDKSRRYIVAIPESELPRLRRYLSEIGRLFKQKTIYLSVAGRVEFVEVDYENL